MNSWKNNNLVDKVVKIIHKRFPGGTRYTFLGTSYLGIGYYSNKTVVIGHDSVHNVPLAVGTVEGGYFELYTEYTTVKKCAGDPEPPGYSCCEYIRL